MTVALSTRRDRAFVTFDGVNRVLEPRLIARRAPSARLPATCTSRSCRDAAPHGLPVLRALRARGVTTSWDFGWNDTLRSDSALPDCWRPSTGSSSTSARPRCTRTTRCVRAASAMAATLARQTVIKLGARGAMALRRHGQSAGRRSGRRSLTPPAPATRSTPAFSRHARQRASLGRALRLGNHVGAQSTRRVGGIDGLPARDRLPAWAAALLEAA